MKSKKIIATTLMIVLALLWCISSLGESKGTTEDVYSELVQLFGDPIDTEQPRSNFESTSKYLGEDGLHIIQGRNTQAGFLFIYNQPNKPSVGSFWNIKNAKEKDYKKMFTFVHDHADNNSITEDNRCTYVHLGDQQAYIYRTGEDKYDKESHDIDEYLSSIIQLYYLQIPEKRNICFGRPERPFRLKRNRIIERPLACHKP